MATAIRLSLGLALIPILFAPLWMPSDYRWMRQSVSETAAQHVPAAGWTRAGFALYGLAALLLATQLLLDGKVFGLGLVPFGLALGASAFWCHRHWDPAFPVDPVADRRHSLAAQAAGLSFTATAVLALVVGPGGILALAALAVATVTPATMLFMPTISGLAQRAMFVVAALWLGTLSGGG